MTNGSARHVPRKPISRARALLGRRCAIFQRETLRDRCGGPTPAARVSCLSELRSTSTTQKLENSSPTCDSCAETNVLCFNVTTVFHAAIEQNDNSVRAMGTNVENGAVSRRVPHHLGMEVVRESRSTRWRPHGDSNPGYRRERAMS